MKILLVSELDGGNYIIDDIYKGLKEQVDIDITVDDFWDTSSIKIFDIIHFQWPEQLFN